MKSKWNLLAVCRDRFAADRVWYSMRPMKRMKWNRQIKVVEEEVENDIIEENQKMEPETDVEERRQTMKKMS